MVLDHADLRDTFGEGDLLIGDRAFCSYELIALLGPEAYPEEEIAALYAERWSIEVKFRDIKSTLGLDQLRVKTPEMARKSLRRICHAYNLIKALQIEAAQTGTVLVTEVGFKGTLDVIGGFRSGFHGLQNRPRLLIRRMLLVSQRLVERHVIPRPGRREPGAVKRKPTPHRYLTAHRNVFRELLHRSHYRAVA